MAVPATVEDLATLADLLGGRFAGVFDVGGEAGGQVRKKPHIFYCTDERYRALAVRALGQASVLAVNSKTTFYRKLGLAEPPQLAVSAAPVSRGDVSCAVGLIFFCGNRADLLSKAARFEALVMK
jgi:hypothetical protein